MYSDSPSNRKQMLKMIRTCVIVNCSRISMAWVPPIRVCAHYLVLTKGWLYQSNINSSRQVGKGRVDSACKHLPIPQVM